MKINASPPQKTVITRDAAKILNCGVRHVRALAAEGRLRSWKLGPACTVFDLTEVEEYAKSRAKGRKAGTVRGPEPGGFRADVTPPKKKRR